MATYVPCKRATEYIFYVGLVQQADTKLLQTTPTLAAGDAKISKDGGATANLNTLPAESPAGSGNVKVTVSATEADCDQFSVIFHDAAGAEWCDMLVNVQTSATQIDNLVRSTTPANTLDIDADGNVTVGTIATGAVTADAIAADAIGASEIAASAIGADEIASGAIGASEIAAAAIDADAIATDAIGADEIAASAIGASEIATDAIGAAEIAAGAIAADEFAQAAADKVWSSASRTLTTIIGVKKNTALTNFEFLMRAAADHITPAVGLAVSGSRSIDGAAFGPCANAVVEVGGGIYKIDLDAADVNGDVITFSFASGAADTTWLTVVTTR